MSNQENKEKLDALAAQLFAIAQELKQLKPELKLNCDQQITNEIYQELIWACENLTTVALHQVDDALNDNLGVGSNTTNSDHS